MDAKPPRHSTPETVSPVEQALVRLRALAAKSSFAPADATSPQAELSLLLRTAVERAALKSSGSMEEWRTFASPCVHLRWRFVKRE
jgi:hypothetical protein